MIKKSLFESYKAQFSDPDEIKTVDETSRKILAEIQKKILQCNSMDGLLFGNVQSGKTRQMLGAISLLADNQFPIFLLLTTDSIDLQSQTFQRVKQSLPDFFVFDETEDLEFFKCGLKKPVVIVLKKNSHILRAWRGHLNTSGYCTAKPLVVFDDEADAASLNTKVNQKSYSAINKHLNSIKAMASSCVYIQVTATPQAILLQAAATKWKPDFVVYFPPGEKYLGGDFFFSDPPPYCIRFTEENELDDVRIDSDFIPDGLRKSLLTFLVVCAHKYEKNDSSCNFLIHPGVQKADHKIFANRIGEHLNLLLMSIDEPSVKDELKKIWEDLRVTKPDILNFQDLFEIIENLLSEEKIRPLIINSEAPYGVKIDDGYNVVIGGNCLGRGLTLPHLQVVYYCRRAKHPQADTSWQHSRMFGYDRDQGLMRVYIPRTLFNLFASLNQSNNILIKQIIAQGLDKIQLVFTGKVNPTRKNVLDKKEVVMISGGVNFFPHMPSQTNTEKIDILLQNCKDDVLAHDVSADDIIKILEAIPAPPVYDWDKMKFLGCVKALNNQRPNVPCKLLVRRQRDISAGTGTLLSPNDRKLGDSLTDAITLTMYRVTGSINKGWAGNAFWIPNIKFPSDTCYYDTKEYL